jgi:uncharacterized protein (DUF952 family)
MSLLVMRRHVRLAIQEWLSPSPAAAKSTSALVADRASCHLVCPARRKIERGPRSIVARPERISQLELIMTLIFKICGDAEWRKAQAEGVYRGSAVDERDGFIHFSTAEQLAETAAKHFAERDDLLLIAVDAEALGEALRFEPSRGGALFPHLYGTLPLAAVRFVEAMPLGADGRHRLPPSERLSSS